jgi:hypothetical protein
MLPKGLTTGLRKAPETEQPAFAQGLVAAYLAGLHEAGVARRRSPRAAGLRPGNGAPLPPAAEYVRVLVLLDHAERPRLERALGMPVEDFLHHRLANIQRRALALATEARDLLL